MATASGASSTSARKVRRESTAQLPTQAESITVASTRQRPHGTISRHPAGSLPADPAGPYSGTIP